MGKIAFLFSGQGAQAPGMGYTLAVSSEAASKVYDRIEAIRPGTRAQCAGASREELSVTANTQPCLFAVDLAAAEALRARGVAPDMVAGFSLGEIPALAFAGMLETEAAFRLVMARASAMQDCVDREGGGMAAVLGLANEQTEAVCSEFGVYPVNYNCPGQLVIAGEKEALAEAGAALKRAGGRVLPLPVGGAFHTPLMNAAAESLRAFMGNMTFAKPQTQVFSNATGFPYEQPYAALIARQVDHPVRWQQIIERMGALGVTTFVEVGIGKTLAGFVRKTLPEADALHVEDPESLENTLRVINGEK